MEAKQKGFTIVELLIVIVVIAILAAITIVSYNGIVIRARDTSRITDTEQLAKALSIYYVENGTYPTPEQITCGGRAGVSGGFSKNASIQTFVTSQLHIPMKTLLSPTGETVNPNLACTSLDQCDLDVPLSIFAKGSPGASVSSRPTDVYQYCTLKKTSAGSWDKCYGLTPGETCDYYALIYNLELITPAATFSPSSPQKGYLESPLP